MFDVLIERMAEPHTVDKYWFRGEDHAYNYVVWDGVAVCGEFGHQRAILTDKAPGRYGLRGMLETPYEDVWDLREAGGCFDLAEEARRLEYPIKRLDRYLGIRRHKRGYLGDPARWVLYSGIHFILPTGHRLPIEYYLSAAGAAPTDAELDPRGRFITLRIQGPNGLRWARTPVN